MPRVGDLLEPNNLRLLFAGYNLARELVEDTRADLSFARTLVRSLLLRGPGRPAGEPVFPPLARWSIPSLIGKRVGVVASGGSGALASLVGVQRALEEAGVEVAGLSASSGGMLFAAPWAAGLPAEEVARFWLSLEDRDYLDVDWRSLARAAAHRFARFGGVLSGAALERAFARRFGSLTLGQTRIPLSTVAWNVDLNRVEILGTRTTPELTLSKAARIAISIPLLVEPVQLGQHLYGDGGVVDIFPVNALTDGAPRFDVVVGVNCYYPEGFAGEDVTGWRERSWAILRASGQLRYAPHLELARQQMKPIADRLMLLQPIPYEEARGARFYEHFLDRASWPGFMRAGHAQARAALERLAEGESPSRAARRATPRAEARAVSAAASEELSAADASWLRMEEPDNPMTITSLLRFDAPLDLWALRRVFAERLLAHDRFRQRVVDEGAFGRPRWEPDPAFDLDAHLRRATLPAPGGEAELEALVGELMSQPIDRAGPLWQVHVVDGLADGGGALIARMGHAIGDGTSLVRMLLSLFDPLPGPLAGPAAEPAAAPPMRAPSASLQVASLGRRVRQGGAAARTLLHLSLMNDPPSAFKGPLGLQKRAAWSAPVPLASLRETAHTLDATVNDLVLTAAAGALGSYLRGMGQHLARPELHAIVPVDLRVLDPRRLGNQFGLVFVPLAVEIEDPLERLSAAREAMGQLKRSPEASLSFDLLAVAARTTASIEHWMVSFFAGKATLVLTNVRGPEQPLALAGQPVRSQVFWAPQSGRVGLGLSVYSSAGELRLGVSSDGGLVPDPGLIARAFVDELERLRCAAAQRLAG